MEMPTTQTAQPATNPRKRKKRAPAPGATVDCFACAEKNLKCDRKRPFCSRCLDAGKDCSGYKTQLTWGVGVASRGKLRGLSLPVAGTEKLSADGPSKNKRRKESTSEQTHPTQNTVTGWPEHQAPLVSPLPKTPSTSPKYNGPNRPWETTFSHFRNSTHVDGDITQATQASQASFGDHSITSPITRADQFQAFPPQTTPWESHTSSVNTSYPLPSPALTAPTSGPENGLSSGYREHTSYRQDTVLFSPIQASFPSAQHITALDDDDQMDRDGISMLLHAGQSVATSNIDPANEVAEEVYGYNEYDDCAVSDELVSYNTPSGFSFNYVPALANICNVGKTARMQYLINYYSEVISPVIVAFDGPTNPFRTHILRLAANSETLQHALSALAASNLRQRRGIGLLSTGKTAPARRSSFAHVHLSNEYTQEMLSPEEQIREETLHKRMAVSQLNQQLAHPILRKDDSILATLLVLCLFHICDSGVAKFQTQFAGVRKLLTLRGDDTKIGTEDSRWMSRLFTWFDSLAATVNDREGQITGHFLDMPALCGDWTLENMAGVDSNLFKTISKLGQLNMLQQGRSTALVSEVSRPMPELSPMSMSVPFIDGNGWYPQQDNVGHDYLENKTFWKEWQDIRHELLTWQLDTTLFDTVSRESSSLTVEQRLDLENISQSFRYSALLYLERLAHPTVPSSDSSIQTWVKQSLSYIKRVQSDVYLLWPLFVTGSECVDEEGRGLIRGRCADIQKDSGFVNNASCLQLLEKIWKFNSPRSSPMSEDDADEEDGWISSPQDRSALMFRKVMIREARGTEGEGEYIVV